MNKRYFLVVTVTTFAIPVLGTVIEHLASGTALSFALFGRWFIFSAVGLRLLIAGIKQSTDPAFTAREIFKLDSKDVLPVVRELGFANLCFGLVGIISLFLPAWRPVSAFASGLYYGIAGAQHVVRRPSDVNERFALWTDLFIAAVLAALFVLGV